LAGSVIDFDSFVVATTLNVLTEEEIVYRAKSRRSSSRYCDGYGAGIGVGMFDNDNGGRMTSYELWKRFDAAGFSVSRLRELELAQLGLTLEQSLMLTIINHCGGSTTTREIEHLTLRQHNSVSTLINRMYKSGLVKKERFDSDRRYKITMTDEGKALFEKVEMISVQMAFSCLSYDEKTNFYKYLKSLHKAARKLLGLSD
jgi:DNA-binding MarR family transcriptional regulator